MNPHYGTEKTHSSRNPRAGTATWLWIRRVIVIAVACLIVTGAARAIAPLLRRDRNPPGCLVTGRIGADCVLAPGGAGALVVSRSSGGIYVGRFPGDPQGPSAAGATASVCAGDGVMAIVDRTTGSIRGYAPEGTGLSPLYTIKAPGAVLAAPDRKGAVAIIWPKTGDQTGRTGFKVRRLDLRGRSLWEREWPAGMPLFTRAWPGGTYVIASLQARDYPSTSLLIGSGDSINETKAIPGLVTCFDSGDSPALVAAGTRSTLYAYDLSGLLRWCVEPGGTPVDISVSSMGVVVAVRRAAANNVASLFVRDFVAMYDVHGARIWKADVKPGVSHVRWHRGGVLVGTSHGILALSPNGSAAWEMSLPSPVRVLEVSPEGSRFFTVTEAGEMAAYSLE